jgi:hypothetical protein
MQQPNHGFRRGTDHADSDPNTMLGRLTAGFGKDAGTRASVASRLFFRVAPPSQGWGEWRR